MKKVGRTVIVMITLIMILSGCAKSIEEQIAEQLELGQKYLLEENYEEAIVAFTKVIELEAKEIQAYTGMASAYIQKNDRKQAEKVLNQGFAIADTLSEEEKTESVNQYIEEMRAMALGNYEELLELAGKDASEAIMYCEKILEMDDSRVELYEELAKLYLAQGEYEKAIEILEKGDKVTGDSGLREYKEQLELEREIEERYHETIQNMVEYLDSLDGELSEEVLMDEEFQKFAHELKEPLIWKYGEKYIGIYPDGYIYYGDMKDGMREGNGHWMAGGVRENEGVKYSYYNKFDGIWKNDYPNGKGIQIHRVFNGPENIVPYTREEGTYIYGYLNGEAVIVDINNKGIVRTFCFTVNHGKPIGIEYDSSNKEYPIIISRAEEDYNHIFRVNEINIFGARGAMKE